MKKPALQLGCQTFTWEMLGASWTGGPDDLVRAIADGGYAGIEITNTMIGSYAGRVADFARCLDDAGLALVSFAFGSDSGFTKRGRSSPIWRPPAAGLISPRTFPGPWFRWDRPRLCRRVRAATSSAWQPTSIIAQQRSGVRRASPSPFIPHRTITRCCSAGPTMIRYSPCWTRRWVGCPTPVTSCAVDNPWTTL